MQGLRSHSIQVVYGELEEEYSGEERGAASGSCSGRSRMLLTEKLNLLLAAAMSSHSACFSFFFS